MNDSVYYRRRALEEAEAARVAGDPAARRAHVELAELHRSKARSLEAEMRRSTFQLVSAA